MDTYEDIIIHNLCKIMDSFKVTAPLCHMTLQFSSFQVQLYGNGDMHACLRIMLICFRRLKFCLVYHKNDFILWIYSTLEVLKACITCVVVFEDLSCSMSTLPKSCTSNELNCKVM